MKKLLAGILLSLSLSAIAYTPDFEVNRDEHNTITLAITNRSEETQLCSYTLSWFENTLNFKKYFGKLELQSNETKVLKLENDLYAKLSKITAHVECE